MTDQQIIKQAATLPPEALPNFIGVLSHASAVAQSRLLSRAPVADQPEEKLLNVAQAAELLGVTKSFLYHRTLPFTVRVGSNLRFSRLKILKYINQKGEK